MNRQRMIVQDLIVWINENIRSPLKIEDVALRAGYSKWHLQRMFFRVMNISLGHYIRNKKLELAAHDLIDSSATVIDISVKYGYESQQSFTRSFVRKYRVPPAAWRRLNTDNVNYLL